MEYWIKGEKRFGGTLGDTWNCFFCEKIHNTDDFSPVQARHPKPDCRYFVMSCIDCYTETLHKWQCSKCEKWFDDKIEQEFSLELPIDVIYESKNVGDWVDYIFNN